ncbi:MAG: bifunctional folylpolyglutamate synthase/dihydrofolate synthase [Anaerolineaceae bacterium]
MKKYIETYDQALDFIYSKIDFSFTKQQRYSEEVFNLDRMRIFMQKLGNPQNTYKTVHVAGTKGKGSISAMIASTLLASGYRTGFYSSPHMVDYTERIQVNGNPIPQEGFIQTINQMYPLIQESQGLTTFEITTAVAFQYFREMQIDIGVIEVGLGGRLDATNIINPEVSVIASISLDHMGILGNTLEVIAGEKAGIIKKDIPVVVSPQKASVTAVFEQFAMEKKAPLIKSNEIIEFTDRKSDLVNQQFKIIYPRNISKDIKSQLKEKIQLSIPLLGKHQMENAGTAFCALKILQEKGYTITDQTIQKGFQTVFWPGRFEILRKNPFLIIDAAHNNDSSQRLAETVQELFPNKKIILLFGASEDKDIQGMLNNFSKITRLIILTRSTHPRAAKPEIIQQILQTLSCDTIIIEDIQQALEFALEQIQKEDIILASGSVFVAAAIRELWFEKYAEKNIS